MAAVDSLNIKVDASARSANQQLDKLVQKMKELRRTVGSLNTHELDTFAKSMHGFTNAAKAMTGMRSSDFTRLAKNLDKITDARKMEKTAQSAEKAAESLEKTAAMAKRALGSSFKTDGTGIQDLQKSIRSLSNEFANAGKGKSFDGTLQELEKEAEKLREKLDKLGEKEQKILAVGGTSAESKTFKGLQYDISATLNQLSALEEKIAQVKSADKQDLSSIPIIRYDAGSANTTTGGLSQFKKNVERVFEGIPESAKYSVEDAKKTLQEALSSVSDSAPSYSFRNYTEEIKALKAELKDLESAGRGMGSDEWDEAYMKLRRVTEEAKEYKAHLDNPTAGLDEDIRKTDSLGNRLESLKTKLKELKASGLNFGDKEFDKTYNNLKNVETELSSYKSKLAGTKTSLKECKTNLVAVRSEATPLGKRFASAFNEITKNVRNSNRAVLSFFRNMKSNLFISSKMSNGFGGLTAKFAKLFVGVRALKTAFSSLKSSIDLASDLTEVQNVVDVAFGKYSKGIEKLSKTSIQNFGMSELTAKQIAGRFQAMGTAVGFSQKKMSGMSVELTKLAADMASFYNVEQEDVAKSLQSVFTGTTQPLRKYGIDLTQATLEEWAHKQGVDADMKSMSQAEKTMLRYKYIISQTNVAQGDFARTSDTWANQTRILKQNFQQLGAIIGTDFINALKPVVKAINSIMGQVIDFATIISNALGKIFGWKYESGGGVVQDYSDDLENAADSAVKTAEATDKAAEAQKKFNKQLQGFDKLNNLTTSSANSNKSDGKGTNGSTDLSGLDGAGGKWTAQDSVLKSFKSDIDSLEKLGGTIADALSKAMESIPWNEIYNKAKDFGSGLASFLNGMFTGSKGKKLFENTGKTIAAAINTSMYAVDEFAKNFKWKSFGENLSTGLNSFFETWEETFRLKKKACNGYCGK